MKKSRLFDTCLLKITHPIVIPQCVAKHILTQLLEDK